MALNPFSLPWSRSPTVAPPFPRLRPRTPACRPPPTRSSGDNQCSNCRLKRWNWTQTFSFPQPTFRPARCGDNGANGEADQVTILLRCPRASSCLWWVPAGVTAVWPRHCARCVSLYAAVCGGCGAVLGLLWLLGHVYVLTHTLDPELRTHRWGNVCSGWWVGNGAVYKFIATFWKCLIQFSSSAVNNSNPNFFFFYTLTIDGKIRSTYNFQFEEVWKLRSVSSF